MRIVYSEQLGRGLELFHVSYSKNHPAFRRNEFASIKPVSEAASRAGVEVLAPAININPGANGFDFQGLQRVGA